MPAKTYRIWCIIEGDTNCFPVILSPTASIGELKDMIMEKGKKGVLNDFDAKDLTLWKPTEDIIVNPSETLIERIKNQFPGLELPHIAVALDQSDLVAEVWPKPPKDKRLHIIVRLPPDRAQTLLPSGVLPEETRDLWPMVTIKAAVRGRGDFGGQTTVDHNRIFEHRGSEPEFVTSFRARLRERRMIESSTDPAVLLLKEELHEFDNYFEDAPLGVGQGDRVSSKNQLWHLTGAFLHHWPGEGDNIIKEDSVWWIFIELGWYFHSVLGLRERHAFRGNWPFKLIVTTEPGQGRGPPGKYRYTPQSDFHVSVDGLVYFLVEIQSDRSQGDWYRMLLQAACAARLGHMSYSDPFVVVALYIENSGRVTQYFIFQLDDGPDPRISYISCVQDWTQPSKLFAAMFEIYNLVSMIQNDREELGRIQERIVLLSNEVEDNFKYIFTSKRTHDDAEGDANEPPKRLRVDRGGQGGNAGGSRRSEHVYHDHQVVDAFTRAGYTLESNDEDENGWAPLNQLKPTMRHAIQSNGTAVIVKLLHPRSNELRILQHLHQINSSFNHTIPLLGTLTLNMGTFVVLREATPLDLGFALRMFCSKVVDFSQQLVDGVGFLHRQGIAHLDIKPQNIVALPDQLFIIDFDISVRVGGPDALIDRWRGTPGWMAPEIGHQDGPKCSYSPIRADLWSCGLMLRYLASKGTVKEENPFETLARQLLNKKPGDRPLLY